MRKKGISILFVLLLFTVITYADNRGIRIINKRTGKNAAVGKQYLVLIAVNQYEEWLPLKNPVKDAKEIRDILTGKYYIDEVVELYDRSATKANIIRLFKNLQEKLAIDDSLFIFYSGHGHLDKSTNTGFWIPVDAGTDEDEQRNWLPNIQIRGFINNIAAMHVCLVSDSCFSGDILDTNRGIVPVIDDEYFIKAYSFTSRQVLTSGASETVPDASQFAQHFKMTLKKNKSAYLDPLMLFNEIRLGVTETQPLLGYLKNTGHQEGASFILFLKTDESEKSAEEEAVVIVEGTAEEKIDEQSHYIKEVDNTFKKKHSNYISLTAGFGITIPISTFADAFEMGIYPISVINYNKSFEWGTMGFGLYTGCNINSTTSDAQYNSSLYSIPIGVNVRFKADFGLPFFFFAEAAAGAAVNILVYNETYTGKEDTTAAKMFAAPGAGAGFMFTENLGISVYGNLFLIVFDDGLFTGVSPGIRLVMNL